MKRVWIGAGLLAVLLTVGILAGRAMAGICPAGKMLEQAGQLALAGHWEASEELLEEAEDHWEDRKWLVTALADHEIIEDIDAALAQLEALADIRDAAAYNTLCSALAKKIEAAGKAHGCTAENFF